MPITVRVGPSINIVRKLDNPDRFASVELNRAPIPGSGAIRAWQMNAHQTPVARSRDCVFQVFEIDVVVHFIERLNLPKIKRGWFDPDPDHPSGYEADAPRDPSHWRLDEANVSMHEYSHIMDVVRAVERRLNIEFNQAGVQEQLTIQWLCDDEAGAYQRLFALAGQRLQAMGIAEFEQLMARFQQHQANSDTERAARRAQIAEHEARQH
ncbi:MAG: hypothetical protein K2Y31_17945 [Burkholderiales bacterium]|jgi:hypothetical protein|nr:hypothetical protein [Burkholderiales bacterium]